MKDSKRGVSIIVLIGIVILLVVGVLTIGNVFDKSSIHQESKQTEILNSITRIQSKLDIRKMAVFTKEGREVKPDNILFEGIFEPVKDSRYYKVKEIEYNEISDKGTMYLRDDFKYIFVANSGYIYPNGLSISNMQITSKVPAGFIAINTVAEFQKMDPEKNYILMKDLDFTNEKFEPIKNFKGVFDGNGHKISNLKYKGETVCKDLNEWHTKIYNNRIDKMLKIEDGSTAAESEKYLQKANSFLNHKCNGNIHKYEARKLLYVNDGYALFRNTLEGSLIKNLTISDFNITANSTVAGLVQVLGGEVRNVTAKNINLKGLQKVGVIAGMSSGENVAIIKSCNVTNEVKNDIKGTTFVGGLIGDAIYIDLLSSSYNGESSLISADMACGGIAGSAVNSNFRNTVANTQIISKNGNYKNNHSWIGGIIGYVSGSEVAACTSDSYISSDTSKMTYVGGLIGNAVDTSISNSVAKGRIINVRSYSGGLVGNVEIEKVSHIEIENCHSNVDIGSIDKVSGGLIGSVRCKDKDSNQEVKISKCYSLANINTAVAGGGFIAWADANLDIENSYAKVNVNVRVQDEASFIARIDSNKAKISNVYTSGYTVASGISNKFINKVKEPKNVKVKNCYYNEKEEGPSNEYGKSVNSSKMTDEKSFKGFNFRNIWTTKTGTVEPELM